MAKHFTKEQIDEIRRQLATDAVRDTDLPETDSFHGEDYVAIVQDGRNKRLSCDTFRNELQNGPQGESTYEIAVRHGFVGTEEEWLAIPQSGQITLINHGTITNAADEEDITAQGELLKLADRPAAYGMGYKILRRNKTFAEQVVTDNTIYEVRYAFDLDGDSVELPEQCILKFVGGCIKNGTLVGDHSRYIACGQVFDAVVLDGTFDNDLSVLDFGVKAIDSEDSEVIAALAEDNAEILAGCVIQSAENTKCKIVVPETFNEEYYYFDTPLELSGTYDFICKGLLFFTGDDETTALTIGETTVKLYNRNFEIRLRRSSMQYTDVDSEEDVPESIGVEIKNANDCTIRLESIMQFAYPVILSGDGTGMCYNNIYLDQLGGYSFCALKLQAINNGWINENVFYGGHLFTYTTSPIRTFNYAVDITAEDSTHAVNNNLFLKPCMEGNNTGVRFTKASGNTFLSIRLESVSNPMEVVDRYSSRNSLLYGTSFSSQGLVKKNTISNNVAMSISEVYKCVQKKLEVPVRVYQTPYSTNKYSYYSNLVIANASSTGSTLTGYALNTSSTTPASLLFGWIINVYEGLTLIINSQHASRFFVKALDSDNVVYALNTGTYTVYDYLEQSAGGYTFTTVGDIQTSADNTFGQFVFKDKITRAFVGYRLTAADEVLTLSVPDTVDLTTLFRDNPIVPDTVPTIPSAAFNVKTGDGVYVLDSRKTAFYNGTEFVESDGGTLSNKHIVLDGSKTFASQVTATNTIYEIRDAFDLDSGSVTVPVGCELHFAGGSVSNGTLVFDISNVISGNPKILCSVSGTLKKADITWFGATSGDTTGDIKDALEKANSISNYIIIPSGTYYIKTAATISFRTVDSKIDWEGNIIYNGSATEIDVITILGNAQNSVLNMSGTLFGSGVSQLTANRFKVKGLVFKNCKHSIFNIGRIQDFNVGMMVIGEGAGCASNTFNLGELYNNNEGLLITQKDNSNNAQGWANENLFIGGTIGVNSTWDLSTKAANAIYIGKIYEADTYNKVNALVFIKTNLESAVTGFVPIYAENLVDSTIFKSRFEIRPDSSGRYIGMKLVGKCGRLTVDSGYNQIAYDLSELETTNNLTPLIKNYEHSVMISEGMCPGVHDSNNDFYSDSVIFKASITSATLGYTPGAPIAHNEYGVPGDWAVKVSFLQPGTVENRLRLRLYSSTSARRDVYVKGLETFDETEVDQSTVIRHANSLSIDTSSRDYWKTGVNAIVSDIVFNENIKTVLIAFRSTETVLMEGFATFRLASQSLVRSGATAARPTYKYTGYQFFDTTLGKMICWNGTAWVNLDGTALS